MEVFGEPKQLDQLQEECGELVAAVNHYRRGRITKEELAEEVADVLIMCEQVKRIVGPEHVTRWKRAKLRRMRDRIAIAEGVTRDGIPA